MRSTHAALLFATFILAISLASAKAPAVRPWLTASPANISESPVAAGGFAMLPVSGDASAGSLQSSLYEASADDTSIDISAYNHTRRNGDTNQVKLLLTSNDVLYYNTSDVSIDIDNDEGTVTVEANDGSFEDVFRQTVRRIAFDKGEETIAEGTYQNGNGIVITEARGWFEAVYVKWEPFDGASSYDVYVKGGQYSDYTQIDGPLVREYEGYCRADVVGLMAAADYSLRIVPVDDDGNELPAYANEVSDLEVVNYDRGGFAHFNYSGVGAYNDDGTLKDGARVFYVHAGNAKTVTCDVVTSSSGKTTTMTGMQSIIDGYQKGYDTTPITFRILGMLTADDMDELSSSAEGLQIKGKSSYSELNMTVEGIGDDATIRGFGILLRNATSVELRNFAIMLCMDDCVSIDTDNSHLWIHNLDLFYGEAGSDDDQAKGDGTVDIKGDSRYVTVYNNRFWDTGKGSLCGMKSESGPNYISYHHNWFDHSDSRHPRVRTMSVHVYNNYYDGVAEYGAGSTMGSSVFVERNYFRATDKPMMISMQGTDIDGKDPTFSSENGGIIKSYANVFADKPADFKYVTYSDDNTEFDAYEVSDPSETVPQTVTAKQGGTTYDNFDTDASLMYEYDADNAEDIPSKVTGYYGAGRLNHGDFTYDMAAAGDDDKSVDEALKAALYDYTSPLVGIFNDDYTASGNDGTDADSDTTAQDDDSAISDSGAAVIFFTDANGTVSDSRVTVSGQGSSSKGSVTYDGTTYTYCLKLSSSAEVDINSDGDYTMTLYFTSTKASSVYVNGEGQDLTSTGMDAGDGYTVYTYEQEISSGQYVITKKNTESNLFLIVLQ